MNITVVLVVMLKSAILMPKNSICPILPLNKIYLRNYLKPKNYLEVPEWQIWLERELPLAVMERDR